MAWLSGWDKRIEIKIEDYAGDIGASVTWFPVTVFLTATQGEEVFIELTTDAEYLKVAFTKADGTTELYGECELFDVSEELGIFHVSRDGWTIDANTSIYMYYDADHADNSTYIGAITARTEVWDGNFKLVCHMVDDNGNIDDSTANNNDGTKKGAGEPAEAAGKVGQGQHYDGTDDWIGFGDCIYSDTLTIEHIINIDSEKLHIISHKRNTAGTVNDAGAPAEWQSIVPADDRFIFYVWGALTNYSSATTGTLTPGTAAYCVGVAEGNGGNVITYLNGTPDGTASQDEVINNTANGIQFGSRTGNDNVRYFDGIMDETRISDTARSAAWVKGTYNSLWDTLLTYGSEETPPAISEFGQYIRLTIDHTKIDTAVSWFPVTVILSSTHGDCVFDELTSDANRFKIAFTKADKTTQLYAEIEKWDDANESAVIHVSKDGWAISNTVDTVFYMYYGADVEDNTAVYIGDINTAAAANVWDSNFRFVCHMVDDNGNVDDSTSNNNDGTKLGAGEPAEAVGKVGQAQNFDGTDDKIIIADNATLDFGAATDFSIELCFKTSDTVAGYILGKNSLSSPRYMVQQLSAGDVGKIRVQIYDGVDDTTVTTLNAYNDNVWHYLGASFDRDGNLVVVMDAATETPVAMDVGDIDNALDLYLGISDVSNQHPWEGLLDEVRISSGIARSAAWIKGTYNSLWDTLLTYGGEEVRINAIFFGSNF